MNPVQFFKSRVAPFRLTKKKPIRVVESSEDQAQRKAELEERRRMAVYRMDQEARRILNGPY
jgi:hypothetical protein